MKKQDVISVFEYFKQQNPEPRTELEYSNNFTLLVAVVLSAQATDKGVNKATPALFAKADNSYDMEKLGEEGIKQYIKTIVLFNSKAKNVYLLSKTLNEKHGGTVPNNFQDLHNLAGVGRKTANVVLNCAFGEPTIAVDTHIFRVSNRLGLAKSKTPDETEKQLLKKVPDQYKLHAHHWLILHGRYICIARKPKCNNCDVYQYCPTFKKESKT